MATLETDIKTEDENQAKLKTEIRENENLISTLKLSFQHMLDVLRHVGEPHLARKPTYSDVDLNLPLLKFTAFAPRSHPPQPFEEDGI